MLDYRSADAPSDHTESQLKNERLDMSRLPCTLKDLKV